MNANILKSPAVRGLSRGLFGALLAVSLASATVLAAPKEPEAKGSDNKGRYYFKQSCKDCHTKGAAGGEVTPLKKTIAQWRTYFQKGVHSRGTEPLTKIVPAEKLIDIRAFLVNHAADSLQPETCGK